MVSTNTQRILVISPHTGRVLRFLDLHDADVFVLSSHPTNWRLFVTAGYDGRVVIWDLEEGIPLRIFNPEPDMTFPPVCVLDIAISWDDSHLATDTNAGYGYWFTNEDKVRLKKLPVQQFFATDHDNLIYDATNNAFDADTNLPPHLMERGPLCDMEMQALTNQPCF